LINTVSETEFFTGLALGSVGDLYGSSNGTDSLYRINPETASSSQIGPYGISHGGGDLAMASSQKLKIIAEGKYSDESGNEEEVETDVELKGEPPIVNNPPSITSEPILDAEMEVKYTYDVDAIDKDGDKLKFELMDAPDGMEIDAVSGLISWLPLSSEADAGIHTVIVQVSDGNGGSDTQEFKITLKASEESEEEESNEEEDISKEEIPDVEALCELYGVYTKEGKISQFFTINLESLKAKLLGKEHLNADIEDLDFHPKTKGLFAIAGHDATSVTAEPVSVLYKVNPKTGEKKKIGLTRSSKNQIKPLPVVEIEKPLTTKVPVKPLPVETVKKEISDTKIIANEIVTITGENFGGIDSIAFHPDGTLWGFAREGNANNQGLVVINTSTAETKLIKKSDIDAEAMAWDKQGKVLWLAKGKTLYTYTAGKDIEKIITLSDLPNDIKGIEFAPNRFLLIGTYKDAGLMIYILNTEKLKIIDERDLSNIQFKNIESMAWPYWCSFPGPQNHPPVITTDPITTVPVGKNYSYDLDAEDKDGDKLKYMLVQAPEGMSIAADTGLISWLPTQEDIGMNPVTVKVEDGNGGSDTQEFNIKVYDLVKIDGDILIDLDTKEDMQGRVLGIKEQRFHEASSSGDATNVFWYVLLAKILFILFIYNVFALRNLSKNIAAILIILPLLSGFVSSTHAAADVDRDFKDEGLKVKPGTVITYKIPYANSSETTIAKNVVITASIPKGTTYLRNSIGLDKNDKEPDDHSPTATPKTDKQSDDACYFDGSNWENQRIVCHVGDVQKKGRNYSRGYVIYRVVVSNNLKIDDIQVKAEITSYNGGKVLLDAENPVGQHTLSDPNKKDDYQIILDSSYSMAEKINGIRKIDIGVTAVKNAVHSILPEGTRLALRIYGSEWIQERTLSCMDSKLFIKYSPLDYDEFDSKISSTAPNGYTPIGLSLTKLREDITGPRAMTLAEQIAFNLSNESTQYNHVAVLVSDGEESCGGDPIKVVQDMLRDGIPITIDAIGFKVDEETRKQLQEIARVTGGAYFDAG
jgi:uncharacterized repeat protein (TIGR01451 family)